MPAGVTDRRNVKSACPPPQDRSLVAGDGAAG